MHSSRTETELRSSTDISERLNFLSAEFAVKERAYIEKIHRLETENLKLRSKLKRMKSGSSRQDSSVELQTTIGEILERLDKSERFNELVRSSLNL
jgi:hypothetical protein